MKVLLDTCIAANVYNALLAEGIDVEWTGNWQPDPGDEAILAYAFQNGRILVTLAGCRRKGRFWQIYVKNRYLFSHLRI
jgi:hypothetical protein